MNHSAMIAHGDLEFGHGRDNLYTPLRRSRSSSPHANMEKPSASSILPVATTPSRKRAFWNRFTGKTWEPVGWWDSCLNIILSSWINVFVVFVPLAFVAHFHEGWGQGAAFSLCFLAIIPLAKIFDYLGEEIALYLGKDLGDLLMITFNNAVEATLAIILLVHCELRLLQSTIVGVIVLHLLLIPGTAFIVGGARVWEQDLHPDNTQLNHSLLTLGVLTILLPTAFFAALDRGAVSVTTSGEQVFSNTLINDHVRGQLLHMSRGLAFVLLVVYVCSRFFLHNPPGPDNALTVAPDEPPAVLEEEEELLEIKPEINVWVCIIGLIATITLMAVLVEFLVESVEFVREEGNIQEEWFGVILLPLLSFSADGALAIAHFGRATIKHITGRVIMERSTLAKAGAIDLSIQFTLFWMPILVLLGWCTDKPMHLMFDYFEVALLIGACFLVNYVTADNKTNWVEGLILFSFYIMIATCAWFYIGQPEVSILLQCTDVATALLAGESGDAE